MFSCVLHYELVSSSFLELLSLGGANLFPEFASSIGEALRLEVFELVHQL